MCGIAGRFSFRQAGEPVSLLPRMIGLLAHRGPDDSGCYEDNEAGLAQARLSIIDPIGGKQPMSSRDGSVWVAFNGEIFNFVELRKELKRKGHVFQTQSDTEVLLHMYEEKGEECVQYFNGQFAVAIWDRREKRMFLSRDRFGICPLYYTRTAGAFLFASEAKALLLHPEVSRELDPEALDDIFTFWFPVAPRTIFRNIQELPPGHSLAVSKENLKTWQYWSIAYNPTIAIDESRAAEDLLCKLEDGVRLRLRSDVPVGSYLSGGLDSTLTTALVRKVSNAPLKTFSIGFDDPEYDETRYQLEAARFLETDHQQVRCTPESIRRSFPSVIWHAERPILRTAPAPMFLLSKLVRDCGIKVVITGEGADELFGGYDIFKESKVRRFWAQQPQSRLRPLLLKKLYPYATRLQTQSDAYLRSFFQVGHQGPFFSHEPRWNLTSRLKVLFSPGFRDRLPPGDARDRLAAKLPQEFATWDWFERAQYLETAYLLPGYLLSSQGERMAMAHSVEARYPFLDHRVAEFASTLPATAKMKVLNEKYLLKRAAERLVPPAVIRRAKQPYRAPEANTFFKPDLPDYARELLAPSQIARDGVFDSKAVQQLCRKFVTGNAIGVRDNMALTGVLSTQLLIHQFLNRREEERDQCGMN